MASQAEIGQLLDAGTYSPQLSPHPTGACTTPTHPPLVPLTQLRVTTPRSDQTPDPESALHPNPPGALTDHSPLLPPGLPSGQTQVQELPQTPFPKQPAAVYSSPAMVNTPVQLPVQLLARLHVPVSAAPSPALWCTPPNAPASHKLNPPAPLPSATYIRKIRSSRS